MEYSVVTFPMNQQVGIISVKSKEQMIGQFLPNAVGMDPRQTHFAILNLNQSLPLKKEPFKAHSCTKGTDYRDAGMLLRSLRLLLNAVK